MLRRCVQSTSILRTLSRSQFTDSRRLRLDQSIIKSGGIVETKAEPISWDKEYLAGIEGNLRRKLRMVDFVVEVRDARIPVSTLHPRLRSWSGKKPRIIVFNKADLISHRDRVSWETHFSEKNIQIIWTSAILKNGGIPNLIRSFFDANFEVNRRRRRTNLILRKNRMVLSCVVGHPNVGKTSLLNRIFGPNPKRAKSSEIPNRGPPEQFDNSLEWYLVEGSVCFMKEPLDVPPVLDNTIASIRLAICGNYDRAKISEILVAEHFIAHLGALKGGGLIMERIYEDIGVHPKSLPPSDFLREVAEVKFEGDLKKAGNHLLESFRNLKYDPIALEMPYMLQKGSTIEEPLMYDKDIATGLQSGICTRY